MDSFYSWEHLYWNREDFQIKEKIDQKWEKINQKRDLIEKFWSKYKSLGLIRQEDDKVNNTSEKSFLVLEKLHNSLIKNSIEKYYKRFTKGNHIFSSFSLKTAISFGIVNIDNVTVKMRLHQECLLCLQEIRALLSASEIESEETTFSAIESYHQQSFDKWWEQLESIGNVKQLNITKDTRALMDIEWAHQHGYLGKGASVAVVDLGFQESLYSNIEDRHGFLVSTIINSSLPKYSNFISVAPACNIEKRTFSNNSYFKFKESDQAIQSPIITYALIDRSSIVQFINFCKKVLNGNLDLNDVDSYLEEFYFQEETISKELNSLLNDEKIDLEIKEQCLDLAYLIREIIRKWAEVSNLYSKSLLEDMKMMAQSLANRVTDAILGIYLQEVRECNHNKIMVKSLGNEGGYFSNLVNSQDFYMADPTIQETSILVVNLDSNKLWPHPSSNVPGASFADMTVCAVGSDIILPVGENEVGEILYESVTGTSFAAPVVAGVAVLIAGAFPNLTVEEIRSCILDSARKIILDEYLRPHLIEDDSELSKFSFQQIQRSKEYFGRGLINAKGAILKAKILSESKQDNYNYIGKISQDV
ncbi:MAG: Subtilase family [Chlamydiales bacterium]|jgi:hypothetical protein|nr:Subtilase family [Chlamydiales bacterium]